MTQEEFDNYKILIENRYANLNQSLIRKVKMGKSIKRDRTNLTLLEVFTGIVMEYKLYTEDETNNNHFTSSEMIDISKFINKILGTTYNPDFVLTE